MTSHWLMPPPYMDAMGGWCKPNQPVVFLLWGWGRRGRTEYRINTVSYKEDI